MMWFEDLVGLPIAVLEKESNISIQQYNQSKIKFSIPAARGNYIVEIVRINPHSTLEESERVNIAFLMNGRLANYKSGVRIKNCVDVVENYTDTLVG